MKYILSLLILITMLTGCSQTPCFTVPDDTAPVVTPTPVIMDTESASCRKVESIGTISYEELSNLPSDKLAKLQQFEFEQCYFKITNVPEGMEEKYVSIWEVGLLAFYENPETDESIKFRWLAEKSPDDYLDDQLHRYGIKKIQKYDIDYYCDFAFFESVASDNGTEQPYHVGIRWVEDDKCFYLKVRSDTPLSDSVVDICKIEKFMIEDIPS